MMRSWLCYVILLTAPLSAGAAVADDASTLVKAVRAHDPAAQVAAPEHSPVHGMYLTSIDGVSGYISTDGRYFIVGDMLDLASRSNVTETQRQTNRRALLQKVRPDEAIVFGPAKPRHTIIVFTDVHCPYCRKLHGVLDQLESQGVAVRYMAFPRSGPNTKAWRTMAAVWCAKDRRDALTRATRGELVQTPSASNDGGIAKHYAHKLVASLQDHAAGATGVSSALTSRSSEQ